LNTCGFHTSSGRPRVAEWTAWTFPGPWMTSLLVFSIRKTNVASSPAQSTFAGTLHNSLSDEVPAPACRVPPLPSSRCFADESLNVQSLENRERRTFRRQKCWWKTIGCGTIITGCTVCSTVRHRRHLSPAWRRPRLRRGLCHTGERPLATLAFEPPRDPGAGHCRLGKKASVTHVRAGIGTLSAIR
jgi:hypothetical protein